MQVIQEENQPDDEQEDDPTQRGEIEFYFIEKNKFSLFHPDLFPLKNDIIRSSFTLDDVKLPPLNEITGGRIFNAPI
jgi:hypothetical protein